MSQSTILVVAPIPGLIMFFLLTMVCHIFVETPEDRLLLLLMQWSIPLSILTIWLVARVLGYRPEDPCSSSSPNRKISKGEVKYNRLI